jgi:beta-lactamase class C
MQKISTMIWTCTLLFISVCCFADTTGREPQLIAGDGATITTNGVNINSAPANTNHPLNTQNAPTTENKSNPADILAGGVVNDTVQPPRTEISPEPIVANTVYNLMNQNRVPGVAVALYVDGRPYLYNFGVANVMTRAPVTENTIFEMGSITKTFTALLLGMEVNEGKMHLQDSVIHFASSLQKLSGAVNYITLEQLATHTSSLPFELPDYIDTQQEFCTYLNRWRPGRRMGSTWAYSNIGFGLLGYMLEGATAETYDQLLHQRILNPLGMYHTEIDVPFDLESNYAQGYNWDGSPAKQWRHNDIIPAEGSLKTSSQDMLKYLMASLGIPGTPTDILSGIHVSCYAYVATRFGLQGLAWEKHLLDSLNDYGFINKTRVLFLRDSYANQVPLNDPSQFDDNVLIDKTGNTAGFTAYIALIPSQKIGVVLLANKAAIREQIGAAGRVILLRLMENHPQPFYKPIAAPATIASTPALAHTITPPHVNPTYYSTPIPTPLPKPVVVNKPKKVVVVHKTLERKHHHKHIVVEKEKVVKHKVIVKKKHHVVVEKKKVVTTATTTN